MNDDKILNFLSTFPGAIVGSIVAICIMLCVVTLFCCMGDRKLPWEK